MSEINSDRLWSSKDTAGYLGIPLNTLYQFNYKGTGPSFYRIGKQIKYFPDEVLAWVKSKQIKRMVF